MRDKRVVEVKCKCGRKVRYGNGGLWRFRKDGEVRCFDCEMKKFSKIVLEEKLEDSIDKGEKM
jgi:hypothetical protein